MSNTGNKGTTGLPVGFHMKPQLYDRLIEFCLVFLIVFTPIAYGAVQPWAIAVFEVTAAFMLMLWIVRMLASGRFEMAGNPLVVFFGLFIFYVSMQFFFSRYPINNNAGYAAFGSIYPWATRTDLLKIISYAIIFTVTLNTVKSRRQISRILSVIIAVGFLMSIFFLMRYFGVDAPRGIINPDHYSGYLGIIIPLILGFLFVRHQRRDIQDAIYAKQFLLLFCAIVMSAALFFTMSRGGMFSFIAALLFMAGLTLTKGSIRGKGWLLSTVVLLLVLTIAWLGATPVVERILSTRVEIASRYFGGRLPIWQGTIEIIRDYPVSGTGFGTFGYIFPGYEPERLAYQYAHAHSDFLELLSETGIAGFLVPGICGLWSGLWMFRRFHRRRDPYVIGLSIGFFGSLTAIFVHSLVDFNLRIPSNAIALTIILSLFMSTLDHKQRGTFPVRGAKYTIHNAGARLLLCCTALLFAGLFITAAVRPALADHYYNSSRAREQTLSPGDLTSGIRGTRLAIKLDPINAEYHYQLGKLLFKANNNMADRNILDAYKEAVRLNPANSRYHQSLAWTYGAVADAENHSVFYSRLAAGSAHRHFQRAIGLEPKNAYRYRAYAIWLFNHPTKENIARAVKEYRKAVVLNPLLADEAEKYLSKYKNELVLTGPTDTG